MDISVYIVYREIVLDRPFPINMYHPELDSRREVPDFLEPLVSIFRNAAIRA